MGWRPLRAAGGVARLDPSGELHMELPKEIQRARELVDLRHRLVAEPAAELSGTLADRHAAHFGPELRRLATTLGSRPVDA